MKIYLVESGDPDMTHIHAAYSDREEAMKHLTAIATEEYENDFSQDKHGSWQLFKVPYGYRIKRSEEARFAIQWYEVQEMEVRDKYDGMINDY
jgi:hypothetical protein